MAIRPTDPEALHLYQLIGAPLLAVIQAETQAAQVSADFIKRVGFIEASRDSTLQQGGDLGDLNVAEFRIDRYAPDGTPAPLMARVPVLSLFPIPLLQVKHADFDFDIHVVTRVPVEDPVNDQVKQLKDPASTDYLAHNRVELKGFLASGGGGSGAAKSVDARIKVKVRLEQSDIPAGLTSLLRLMTESVSVAPAALVEAARRPKPEEGP